MDWMRVAVLGALMVTGTVGAEEREDQRAWLVFDRECVKSVGKTDHTVLKFPMVNGEPELKSGILTGVTVDYEKSCGKYVVEKVR